MNLPPRPAGISFTLVIILAIILAVLVVLHIRWTNRISQADRERIQTNMQTQARRFRRDFFLQLVRICWSFQSPERGYSKRTLKFYADRYEDWMNASARPDMVAGLFIWDRASGRLLRLDPSKGWYAAAAWPQEFQSLRDLLEDKNGRPATASALASMGQSWMLDEESHALFHPFANAEFDGQESRRRAGTEGGVILDLNMDFVWRTLTPELAGRYFGGPGGFNYRVSVISAGNRPKVFYQSSPAATGRAEATGDLVQNLIRGSGGVAVHSGDGREFGNEDGGKRRSSGLAGQSQGDFLPIISALNGGNAWRLVLRHRSGSVEAAVLSLRRRDLGVSLGVLLLLAVSIGLIVVSAQRAQALARLQMDFMAGVSHELRTPLAVICSAAENLADGVVQTPEQVENYGTLIRNEGRRLAEMVGQILSFAPGQRGRQTYQMVPVNIVGLVEESLITIQPQLDGEQITVEKHLELGIHPVLGDPQALQRCVRNLISNGVKYGGADCWLGIRAQPARVDAREEVQIVVEDHGNGIDPEDLPHIFEPFYRGKDARATQIHGTGLGLSIANDIAVAMGGRLSVNSGLGKGSCFTLHLPALEVARRVREEQPRGYANTTRL